MRSPRTRELVFSATGALLVLGILAAVNALASFAHLRLDLSSGGAYSVSRGTKDLLARLEDTLLVKVYYTPRLPPPYGVNGQYLRDLLDEYRDAGRGRVKLEFPDPSGETVKREAQAAGVLPVQLNVMARDRFEAKEAYMGAVLLYRGRAEVLPLIEDAGDLEYELSRRVLRLIEPKKRVIGLVTGHREKTPSGMLGQAQAVFDAIRAVVDLQTVSLDRPVPAGVDALWVLGPESRYKPSEVERLKEWASSGRSLGLLLDRRQVDLGTFFSSPLQTGLEPLLESWGAELSEPLVADEQAERIRFESSYGRFTALRVQEYPFIPVSTRLNARHPAVRRLQAVTFPFVHAVTFKAPQGSGLRYTSLAESSERSWLHRGYSLAPDLPRQEGPQPGEKGRYSLAGIIEGERLRVVLVGTSFQTHPTLVNKANNGAFLLNLMEWSLQQEALLSIRARSLGYRPLRPLSDLERPLLKSLLIFLLPGVLVAAGLLMARRDAARRRAARTLYAAAATAAPAPAAAGGQD